MVKECNVRKELEIRLEKVSWRQMWMLLNARELFMLIYSLGEVIGIFHHRNNRFR